MKKLIASILMIGSISACNNASKSESSRMDSLQKLDNALADTLKGASIKKEEAASSSWDYSEDEDKMSSKKTYFARTVSDTQLNFDFPYKDAYAYMTIRKKRGENDVIIGVSEGQFKTQYDGTSIRVRFDNERPQRISVLESSDGSSNVIFIENTTKFIKNLKTHKKLIVEAEFYSEGIQQIEYNIENFKWNH